MDYCQKVAIMVLNRLLCYSFYKFDKIEVVGLAVTHLTFYVQNIKTRIEMNIKNLTKKMSRQKTAVDILLLKFIKKLYQVSWAEFSLSVCEL